MNDPRTPRRRLVIVLAGALGWSLVIAARLIDVQVYRSTELRDRAVRQQFSVVDTSPVRGAIRDRHGVELALSRDVRSVYAVPALIESVDDTADELARLLGISRDRIRHKLSRDDRDFVWIKRKILDEQADRIAALNLPGVGFRNEPKRFYPRGQLAAHVLGFVGLDNHGMGGLEAQFDAQIRGIPGYELTWRDARGVRFTREPGSMPAEPGRDLVLTLDASIQHLVERELAAAVKKHNARAAVAVVLDPWNGDVLAMAGEPTFDPNEFGRVSAAVRRNPAVQEAYEPGSTFKAITFATAIEQGRVRHDEIIDCGRGSIRIGRATIRDHKSFDKLTPTEIIKYSSNVGAIIVGSRVASDDFYDSIRRFGFGHTTGIELPGESAGVLRPPRDWSSTSQPSISMGQEIAVTPIQLATAFAAIANGGTLVRPRIVLRLESRDEVVSATEPRARRRVVSPQTTSALTDMLATVVTASGTGQRAVIDGVALGGKTGTAQKIINGQYATNAHIASFAAIAPLDRPRIVVLVAIDEPKGSEYHGGQVAAPIVKRILEPTLALLGETVASQRFESDWIDYYAPTASDHDPVDATVVARR